MATRKPPFYCALCRRAVRAWDPDPRFGTRGVCPYCGSLPRNRLLAIVLARLEPITVSARAVVQVGPAPDVTRHLVELVGHGRYIGIDLGLDARNVDILADLCRLPMVDDSVDVLVAFHVLEHIPDDATAMAEIARVIGRHGIAVIQVPWRRNRPTVEDPSASVPERIERFGQKDHVRYYGGDFVDRLRAAGLQVAEVSVDRDLDAEVVAAGDLRGCLWLATGEPSDPNDWSGMIEAVVQRRGNRPARAIVVDPYRKIRDIEHEVTKLRQRLMNEHLEFRRRANDALAEDKGADESLQQRSRREQMLERRLQAAYSSKSYRVGHAVLTPFRLTKRLYRRIKPTSGRPRVAGS